MLSFTQYLQESLGGPPTSIDAGEWGFIRPGDKMELGDHETDKFLSHESLANRLGQDGLFGALKSLWVRFAVKDGVLGMTLAPGAEKTAKKFLEGRRDIKTVYLMSPMNETPRPLTRAQALKKLK